MTTQFMDADGLAIAYQTRSGTGPGLVWLGGYRSDMNGTKANFLDAFAAKSGHAFLRHDYSGHGQSGGSVNDGTISQWVKQSLAVFRAHSKGPQVLIGSSMGAWIALRMMQELQQLGEASRVAGLALLAPAPDFTSALIEPRLTEAHQRDLREKGYFEDDSDYLPEPNRFSQVFLDDGRKNRVMSGMIESYCPVHIIQGMKDMDVPYEHALTLAACFAKDCLTMSLIPDGDHRLSRPQDLEMVERAVAAILARYVSNN